MFDSSIYVKKMWGLKKWYVTKVAHCNHLNMYTGFDFNDTFGLLGVLLAASSLGQTKELLIEEIAAFS